MNTRRKICVVTGTRAEYGLLYWLMREIDADDDLELQVVVTGMHLSPEFGQTYRVIEQDGFHIDAKVEMLLSSDSPVGVSKSLGLGILGFADAFDRLKPDIVVILGDRYEVFAAAQAALVGRYPIAHIHGGERTEGVIDDAMRHAITKLAHIHFVAAEPYRRRVIQLGEDPNRVLNYGAPGLDSIRKLPILSRDELEREIDFELGDTSFLITYHPVTLQTGGAIEGFQQLLTALGRFPESRIIFTHPNSDTDGRAIRQMIDEYQSQFPSRVRVYTSMGQLRYLSALKQVSVVIGNSSSGIIEAPALKTPTVNIGNRQTGRLKASSIIDCEADTDGIVKVIQKALSPEFQASIPKTKSLYGEGDTSVRIKEFLKSASLDGLIQKKFYDIAKNQANGGETK